MRPFFSWPKCQDKNLNVLRMERAFVVEQKTFFIFFKGLSVARKLARQFFHSASGDNDLLHLYWKKAIAKGEKVLKYFVKSFVIDQPLLLRKIHSDSPLSKQVLGINEKDNTTPNSLIKRIFA